MSAEVEIAVYRPRVGRAEEALHCLRTHVTTLQQHGFVAHAPVLFLRSRHNGIYLEIFMWVSADAMERAHTHPDVRAIWAQLAACTEYMRLSHLREADELFPHFEPL